MPIYDYYPAVDEAFNFPPEVQAAIARSVKLGDAVSDTATPMGGAIATLIAKNGGLKGLANLDTSIVAGTLIAQANGGWVIDNSDLGKSRSINIDSLTIATTFEDNSGRELKVDFGNLKGKRVIGMQARLDGGARVGYRMGVTSVTPTSAIFNFWQQMPEYSDYIFYDSTAPGWRSARGDYYVEFLNGVITAKHYGEIPEKAKDNLSITPRGDKYQYVVSTDSTPTTKNSVRIEVRNNQPPIAALISWDGAKWISSNPDQIWVNGFLEDTAEMDVGHIEIPQESIERINITRRGPLEFVVWGGAFPLTRTHAQLEVWRGANLDRSPRSGDHRLYIQRGGGSDLIMQPNNDMKFFIRHGGGERYVSTTEFATANPGARLSLFAIIEK